VIEPTPCLWLEFASIRGEPLRIEGIESLRFEGRELVVVPGGPLARHHDHRWFLLQGGETYPRLECSCECLVFFVSHRNIHSRQFGPFTSFSSVDAVAYANHRVIAFCDDQNDNWYSYDLGTHWKSLVLRAV
jgi:hypothetical protein